MLIGGTRGVRVIAATTYVEYRDNISANQPLVERFQRISLAEPNEETCIKILEGMAVRYGVNNLITDRALFKMIYDVTNQYIPANSQPRKSILMLDNMIGWHRAFKRPLDRKLLADVVYSTQGVNISFRVDAESIKTRLDEKVFDQEIATSILEQRLQICVADLNNKSKPAASFLFTGSTGVGKAQTVDTLIPCVNKDGEGCMKRAGDITLDDTLFDRKGNKTKVLGIFPQGIKQVYRVTLEDGRDIEVAGNHLWSVKDNTFHYEVLETEEILDRMETCGFRYRIPLNGAVDYPEIDLHKDPYWAGYELGNNADDDKRLPDNYKFSSRNQRKELLKGFMDSRCYVLDKDKDDEDLKFFSSEGLAEDLTEVLRSLGYLVIRNGRLVSAFEKGMIRISKIEKLSEYKEMVCFLVDNEEHLYQASEYIVTHNTEVTKQLAEILFNDRRSLIRFDMTEYANSDMLQVFKDEVTTAVWERPYSILLFDEIEKAAAPITRLLLQVLDDARLTDRNGRVISFANTYIIATTNAAAEIYNDISKYDKGEGDDANALYDELLTLIKRSIMKTTESGKFPPELLGRFDTVVPFKSLSDETKTKIIFSKLDKFRDEVLAKHGVGIMFNKKIVNFILEELDNADANAGGARQIISLVENRIIAPTARYINKNPRDRKIAVKFVGTLKSEDKVLRKASGNIEISKL